MIMFHELISDEAKFGVLELLKSKKEEQWRSNNFKDYWQTSRIVQSLDHNVVGKKIFVQNSQNIKVILLNFSITKGTEYYEVWIDENLSKDDLKSICTSLLDIAYDDKGTGKMSFFLMMPQSIGNLMAEQPCGPRMHLIFDKTVNNYYLDNDMKFDSCPMIEGFETKPIPEENVKKIIANWAYSSDDDTSWMRQCIRDQLSMSIWDLADNSMAGHFIFIPIGTFGALFVDPKYRGLGLAKILIGKLLEVIRVKDMDFLITIDKDNPVSINMFEKLNFRKSSESVILIFDKVGEFPASGNISNSFNE